MNDERLDRLDELIREAALAGPTEPGERSRRALPLLVGGAALAGVLLAAAVGGFVLRSGAPAPRADEITAAPGSPKTPEASTPETLTPATSAPKPEREPLFTLVLEIPLVRPEAGAAFRAESIGQVARAADADRPGTRREAELLEFGRTLRSAMEIRETLDAMTPAEQLRACRVWAEHPTLRPVTFERLLALREDPAVRDEVLALVDEMRDVDELRPWLRSYRLVRK